MNESNLRKKFHGWFYTHKDRHSSFVGNLLGLRQSAHVVTKPSKEKEIYLERIVYVGCIHGGSDDIYKRLEKLKKYPPDYLIFAGDLTGSADLEKLKKHFYDEKERNPHSPYLQFEYFGEWAATLPKVKRERLLSELQISAKRILSIIQKIKKHGTKIYILEGNWDNRQISGIRMMAGKDIPNVFDTQKFLINHGFPFISHLEILKTKTTLHIFLPYVTLLHYDSISKHRIKEVLHDVEEGRNQGKAIVMVGHAEANWRVHHLYQKNSRRVYGERGTVIRNFQRAMAIFKPNEVIYPHQHARIRDERGKLVDLNAKYILQIRHNGISLIDKPNLNEPDDKQIVATYVPLGYLAEEDFIG